jgi:F0F1-type ATP synthase, beta subunit
MTTTKTTAATEGRIIRIQGTVVDVRFPGEVPELYEALEVTLDNGKKLVLETEYQLGDNETRTLALGPTFGLKRGTKVVRTHRPIAVPVGEKTLGRIFNVLGETVDSLGAVSGSDVRLDPIHREAPALSEQKTRPEMLETGVKVIDLISPFTKGGKIGIFGGAGVGRPS